MRPLFVPTSDVNSESAVIRTWHVPDRAEIAAGELVAEVETSKAIIDVNSTDPGFILHAAPVGEEVRLTEPVGHTFGTLAELESFLAEREQQPDPEIAGPRATAPARRRAAELGVELAKLPADRLITAEMVEAAARTAARVTLELQQPLAPATTLPKVAVFGAGLGATQVIDILRAANSALPVAVCDDDVTRWAEEVEGVPVVGGAERMAELFGDSAFDAAVISISTSIAARTRLRRLCTDAGVPLINAIDPTARITSGVTFGTGNVVCAHCHFGVGTTVGDNNFFSAYNSFDHHNRLGSDISTGPACASSGLVEIGDRVRLGTGIYIEPHVHLGDDVEVASGSTIVSSVPANHSVKRRVTTTVVVPRR